MTTALILAGAECVWKDAEAAIALMGEPDAICAVNDMIYLWPGRLDYAATLHVEKLAQWVKKRPGNKNFRVWSNHAKTGLVHRARRDGGGSSSLFAVFAMLDEGFDRIVVAGAPMVPTAGHVVRKQSWQSAHGYRKGWIEHHAAIKNRVRSMSGWTKERLGAPSLEWLTQE